MKNLASLIKRVRLKNHKRPMTQEQFAKMLGISAQNVYHWETQKAPMALQHIKRLIKKKFLTKNQAISALTRDHKAYIEKALK